MGREGKMKKSVSVETKAITAAASKGHAAAGRSMVAAGKRFGLALDPKKMAMAVMGDIVLAHAGPKKQSGEGVTTVIAISKKVQTRDGNLTLKPGIYRATWRTDGDRAALEFHDVSGQCVGTASVSGTELRESSGKPVGVHPMIPLSGSIDWEKICADVIIGRFHVSICYYF
jgi:hypothetical protein